MCLLAFAGLDHPLSRWVSQYLSYWQKPFVKFTEAADNLFGPLFYGYACLGWLLLFLLGRFILRRPIFTLLLITLFTRISSEIAANIIKALVHRPRPGIYAAATDSFPSSHTAVYWGLLLPVAACLPRYRAHLLVLPVLISIGRIVENVHYLSDVLAAIALVGLITSFFLLLAHWLDRSWRRQNQSAQII